MNQWTPHIDFIWWVNEIMKKRDYFGCIYGSCTNGTRHERSDIDFCCATDGYSEKELRLLIWYITEYYARNKLLLDEEVPFANKLLATYEEVISAVYMSWFELRDSRFVIPRIQKDSVFLSSPEIKKRLLLNILTTPHFVFGNNFGEYNTLRDAAEKGILLLAIDLIDKIKFQINELIEVLTISKEWEVGEMYLWYKRNKIVVLQYLERFIRRQIDFLTINNITSVRGNVIEIIRPEYLDEFKRRCTSLDTKLQCLTLM